MSDDFGTVSLRRGDGAREIEVMREQYRRHRDTLGGLAAEAPTAHLADEYHRLIQEIDASLVKLDDLERGATAPPAKPTRDFATGTLRPPPENLHDDPRYDPLAGANSGADKSRVVMIIGAGLAVLVVIAWLIWRGSEERPVTPIVSQTTETTAPAPVIEDTVAPATRPVLRIAPELADYGTIRKGTRAVRQFEISNGSDAPIQVQVERSGCKCLLYDYVDTIPAKGKETLTVTVDGARAPAGTLAESIEVSSKADPAVSEVFQVRAKIQ